MCDTVTGWEEHVVLFLLENLPKADGQNGWRDNAMTAYQIGCDALCALVHAERTNWGTTPLARPDPPLQPPRWDDI